MEDGLDIGLVEFCNTGRIFLYSVKQFIQFQIVIIKQAHNTSPLPRLPRRQMFVVFPIIQYRPALCKADGGISRFRQADGVWAITPDLKRGLFGPGLDIPGKT